MREGFLTIPAFLTLLSRADRTSPTSRAKTILEQLFCAPMVPPANVDIPELGAADGEAGGVTNVRKEIEKHRASPDCAGCHDVLDPIGLSLENFDPIGAYRTQYPNGDPIRRDGGLRGRGVRGHLRPRAGARGGRPDGDVPLRAALQLCPAPAPERRGQDQDRRISPRVGRRHDPIWRSRW